MAFKAELELDGETYRLLHCSVAIQRDIDPNGRPSSIPRGGQVTMEVESTDKNALFEWISNPYSVKAGTITFFKRDSDSKMKELKFENGYIVQYAESFDSVGDNPMTINFTVSAEKVDLNGTKFVNPWPKS